MENRRILLSYMDNTRCIHNPVYDTYAEDFDSSKEAEVCSVLCLCTLVHYYINVYSINHNQFHRPEQKVCQLRMAEHCCTMIKAHLSQLEMALNCKLSDP